MKKLDYCAASSILSAHCVCRFVCQAYFQNQVEHFFTRVSSDSLYTKTEPWLSSDFQLSIVKPKSNKLLEAETHDATLKSRRHVASSALLLRQVACSYFAAAICRTNSNQFEFVRQIAATKFCRSDDGFHMSHEAICCSNLSRRRVAAICRIVCLGLYTTRANHNYTIPSIHTVVKPNQNQAKWLILRLN